MSDAKSRDGSTRAQGRDAVDERRARWLAGWSRLVHALATEHDLQTLSVNLCREVVEGFGFSRALLALIDERRRLLIGRAGYDPSIGPSVYTALLRLYRVPLDPDPSGKFTVAAWCVTHQEQAYVSDASRYDFRPDQTMQLTLLVKAFGVQEYVLTPIVYRGRSVGMLGIDKRGQSKPITPEERAILASACEAIGTALGPLLERQRRSAEAGGARDVAAASTESTATAPSLQRPDVVTSLLDGLDDAILVVGADRRIRYANRAAVALCGTLPWDVAGRMVDEIFPVEDSGHSRMPLEHAERPRPAVRTRWRHPSGGELDVEIRTIRVSPADQPDVWCLAVRNLSEETALQRAQDAYIAMLVHDLKAPLQGMIGFAELLRMGRPGPVNAEQVDFLHRIESNGEVILQLVKKILEAGRFEAGGLLLRKEPVLARPLVQGVLTRLASKALDRGVRLANAVADDLPAVAGDPVRLIQLFQNLLDNAVAASRRGGLVRVASDVRDDNGVAFAEFSVITERVAVATALSEPTRSETPSRTPGLGLAIARLIVQAHRGEIWIEDRANGGVVTRFRLPLDPDGHAG